MRQLLFCLIGVILLGCNNRVPTENKTSAPISAGDVGAGEPRFVFTAPDGFEWNDEHRFWYNKNLRTSVNLAHAPDVSFKSVVNDFVPNRMLESNLEMISKDARDIDGRPTLLVHAKRLNAKYPREICTVAYATAVGCAQLTAIYPADMTTQHKKEIEAALLNSRYEIPEKP